jgi:N-acetylmuramoyl-L-alanine amidase
MNIIDVTKQIHKNNYSTTQIVPIGICLHITADSGNSALNWFGNPQAKVSAHDIIQRDGTVYECVASNMMAYHAGRIKNPTSRMVIDQGARNPNQYLIGIEVVSRQGEGITDAQRQSIQDRVLQHCKTYNIAIDRYHIIGHNEINSIDKIFCPVSSYSPGEIIIGIKMDQAMHDLSSQMQSEILQLKAKLAVAEAAAEIEKLRKSP